MSCIRCGEKVCLEFVSKGRETIRVPTFGAAMLNALLAVSVRVLGTNSRRASVDRSDRVVS